MSSAERETMHKKKGKQITLAQARNVAMKILSETDNRLKQERKVEIIDIEIGEQEESNAQNNNII